MRDSFLPLPQRYHWKGCKISLSIWCAIPFITCGCGIINIEVNILTHWGRLTHICVSNLTNIGSDNVLSPGRRQAIIWTNAGISLIGTLGTNFNEMLIEIHAFSFTKIHLKMSSGKWRPFCLGLNVLTFQSALSLLMAWPRQVLSHL